MTAAEPSPVAPPRLLRPFLPAAGGPGYLWARWLFLRALGLIFFSAFYSLAFQIHGLIGERGILPAGEYLASLSRALPGLLHVWVAPTLLWLSAGDRALTMVVSAGIVCSLLLVVNVWPRLAVALATLLFLSCIGALQDFSSYQSDGMLLEAGFISIFFAPRGLRPGLGAHDPPSPASLWLLRWEWFRIYFESGVVKLASGDPHWRDFTAMDEYYQNGPLPAWPGWYVQHFPHWYHAATVLFTFVVELVVVWAVFLPRRFRLACFVVVTALQVGIIATANYAFLNYLVLVLGVLLVDDGAFAWLRDRALRGLRASRRRVIPREGQRPDRGISVPVEGTGDLARDGDSSVAPEALPRNDTPSLAARPLSALVWLQAVALTWVAYATVAVVLFRGAGPLGAPARWLEPFRIANQYGLFAVMTEARYEVEFQGSRDGGRTWVAYPFRYKPQDPRQAPRVFAPYQPRFDWNLWFASLGPWRESQWVVLAQARLLEGSPSVLRLFAADPFDGTPPTQVRTVLWRYWFTDAATKRATGAWWRREALGPFTGVLARGADGRFTLDPAP